MQEERHSGPGPMGAQHWGSLIGGLRWEDRLIREETGMREGLSRCQLAVKMPPARQGKRLQATASALLVN